MLAGAGVTLTACTPPATPAASPTTSPESIPLLPEQADELDAGTYLVTGFTVPFQITVPEGWSSFGWGVLKQDTENWLVFVNFLPPTAVPTDACKWRGTFVEIEPTPGAYVDAMAAQTSSQTSVPIDVTMGDYSGYEFDYTVDSSVDFTDCDMQRLCLFADSGLTTCTRTYESVQERETERIVDLNGELAMFAVGQFTDVDPSVTAEARTVFDSITFDPPNR